MHPGFIGWWHARRAAQCGVDLSSHGPGAHGGRGHGGHGHGDHGHRGPPWAASGGGGEDPGFFEGGGGAFGVRRPLRFLAFKLELDEPQVEALARVLSDLKTERAQAAVDHRRTMTALADAVAADGFDGAAVSAAIGERAKSAARVADAVGQALGKIHGILRADQRTKLAYLLRTGALSI